MAEPRYEARLGSDERWFVNGPGSGLGYYSGTLWPELRLETQADAERAAMIANIAYAQGHAAALREVREVLGAAEVKR